MNLEALDSAFRPPHSEFRGEILRSPGLLQNDRGCGPPQVLWPDSADFAGSRALTAYGGGIYGGHNRGGLVDPRGPRIYHR
jgi:hypothetical protein